MQGVVWHRHRSTEPEEFLEELAGLGGNGDRRLWVGSACRLLNAHIHSAGDVLRHGGPDGDGSWLVRRGQDHGGLPQRIRRQRVCRRQRSLCDHVGVRQHRERDRDRLRRGSAPAVCHCGCDRRLMYGVRTSARTDRTLGRDH